MQKKKEARKNKNKQKAGKRRSDLDRKENIFFLITTILLILFQASVYIKACRIPELLSFNLFFLYIAVALPFVLKHIKVKWIVDILLVLYLIYMILVFIGFFHAMTDQNYNCRGIVYVNLVPGMK